MSKIDRNIRTFIFSIFSIDCIFIRIIVNAVYCIGKRTSCIGHICCLIRVYPCRCYIFLICQILYYFWHKCCITCCQCLFCCLDRWSISTWDGTRCIGKKRIHIGCCPGLCCPVIFFCCDLLHSLCQSWCRNFIVTKTSVINCYICHSSVYTITNDLCCRNCELFVLCIIYRRTYLSVYINTNQSVIFFYTNDHRFCCIGNNCISCCCHTVYREIRMSFRINSEFISISLLYKDNASVCCLNLCCYCESVGSFYAAVFSTDLAIASLYSFFLCNLILCIVWIWDLSCDLISGCICSTLCGYLYNITIIQCCSKCQFKCTQVCILWNCHIINYFVIHFYFQACISFDLFT